MNFPELVGTWKHSGVIAGIGTFNYLVSIQYLNSKMLAWIWSQAYLK